MDPDKQVIDIMRVPNRQGTTNQVTETDHLVATYDHHKVLRTNCFPDIPQYIYLHAHMLVTTQYNKYTILECIYLSVYVQYIIYNIQAVTLH